MWNRRSFPRRPANCEVVCGAGTELSPADVCEISELGIGFNTRQDYPVGSELNLHYRFDPKEDWVKVKVAVRHRRGRRIGAEFLNLPLKERVKFWDRQG